MSRMSAFHKGRLRIFRSCHRDAPRVFDLNLSCRCVSSHGDIHTTNVYSVAFAPLKLERKRPSPGFLCVLPRSFGTSPPPTSDNDKEQTPTNKQELLNNWLRQLKSPPNLITLSRILSTPVLSYFIITKHYDWALYGSFAAGVSDALDGFLAKRYNMGTVLGTYLDPLADKILINVLSISLWYSDILPTPLIVLWLGRDVVLMAATYHLVSSSTKSGRFVVDPVNTPLKVEPTNISKVNTAFQFLTLGIGMLQPVCGVPDGLLETLCWITGGTTIASALSYVGGKSLTASGNTIRDTVQKKARALRERARRKRRK